jgi:hypothetical protein
MGNAKKKVPMKYVTIAGILTVMGSVLGWFIRNK